MSSFRSSRAGPRASTPRVTPPIQRATGLALTILGLGLAGLIGQGFVGQPRGAIPPVEIPLLKDIPVLGKAIFIGDPVFFLSLGLIVLVAYVLNRTRIGLLLRAVGENHVSAHALGLRLSGSPPSS